MQEGRIPMREKKQIRLSYESDGKMGELKKEKDNKKNRKDFFNTTQDSE
jgi:hypothetical protein